MDFHKAEIYIKQLLQSELSPLLAYHDYDHTMDVLEAAIELAGRENIMDSESLTLLKTAALFHDCGYVHAYENHEEESCRIAGEVLPGCGYQPEQIRIIQAMILKTKLSEKPVTHLEQILCDADLDYLGGDNFESRGTKLYREWVAYGLIGDEKEWNEKQIRFLESHRYYTKAAMAKGDPGKAAHLRKLKEAQPVKS
jgi:predicted metal-dependent HD superfamily phosphohydrolase